MRRALASNERARGRADRCVTDRVDSAAHRQIKYETRSAVMPTFDTPGPIAATVDVAGAQVRVTASDRTDTVVLVEPIDTASQKDVKVAEQDQGRVRRRSAVGQDDRLRGQERFGRHHDRPARRLQPGRVPGALERSR